MKTSSCFVYTPILATLILCAGCADPGPPLGTVTGTITLEGEPVKDADVEFHPLFNGGKIALSRTDENGDFEMQYSLERKGVLVGNHQVQITTRRSDKRADGSNVEIPERIPKWYWGPDGILEFDVKEGANVANFELTKKKPKKD